MKILVLTSRFPWPLEKGDKLRVYHQIRMLSLKHEIILCSLTEQSIAEKHFQELEKYCTNIYLFPISRLSIGANLVKGLLKGDSLQISWFYRGSILKQIREIVKKETPDHLYCQLIRMSEYGRRIDLPRTLDIMDCFSIGMDRRADESPFWLKPFFRREAKKLRQYEANILSHFDYLTIISEQDRDLIQSPQRQKIQVIPNGIDLAYFQPDTKQKPVYDLVFVGNMGYSPNVIAAGFLVKKVMPLIWASYPDTTLLLAGARPVPAVKALEKDSRVAVSGWVENIRDAYQNGKIFVAPLFTGSGQQNKIIEAMALEVPCITTPLVNNAIGAKVNEEILIADSDQGFAQQILDLLADHKLRRKLSKNGRAFVSNNFSWEESVEKLNEIWEAR